jgi:hypothetical protein
MESQSRTQKINTSQNRRNRLKGELTNPDGAILIVSSFVHAGNPSNYLVNVFH